MGLVMIIYIIFKSKRKLTELVYLTEDNLDLYIWYLCFDYTF